jgi:hypothetical protein
MLERIENGEANGILAWLPDRLSRNSIDSGRVIYMLDENVIADLKFPHFWFENTPPPAVKTAPTIPTNTIQ